MSGSGVRALLAYIGANVARLRLRRGFTQEQLAERVGIGVRHLIRIQRGEESVSLETLVSLGEALGVRPERLMRRARPLPPRAGRPRRRRVPAS